MVKKYLLISGDVISKKDGQRHRVSARRLVDLYRLPIHECILQEPEERIVGVNHTGLITLYPRQEGDYDTFLKGDNDVANGG